VLTAACALVLSGPAATVAAASPPVQALLSSHQSQLLADDGAVDDYFGYTVAISGDTVVVGTPYCDVAGRKDQGGAYVYTRAGALWPQQQKLVAPDGAVGDNFGCSVAVSGDSVVVGARTADVGGAGDQGAAYVFTRQDAVWTLQQKLTASDGAAQDWFGCAVALSGDTVLVGSPFVSVPSSEMGAAYVFTRSGGVWSQQQRLASSDGATGDSFGLAVALSGDAAVVSSYHDDVGTAGNQGSAYVFVRTDGQWSEQQKLTADDGAADDYFGTSLAISGGTIVVGATGMPEENPEPGAVYVFERSGASWPQQQKLTPDDGAAMDCFGCAVAVSGDTAVVTSYRDDIDAASGQGSAYVFTRSAAVWSQRQHHVAADGAAGDWFGYAAALDGESMVVTARNDAVAGKRAQGSATVVALDLTAPITTAALGPAPGAGGWCRSAVTLALSAVDTGWGVAACTVDPGTGVWMPYDDGARPVITAQGETIVQYRATDLAGNAEQSRSATVRIDSKKPVTTAYRLRARKGTRCKLGFRVNDALPGSGRAAVTLRIYKGRALKRTIRLQGTVPVNVKKTHAWRCVLGRGAYTIKVFAKDLAGNRQSRVGTARLTVF